MAHKKKNVENAGSPLYTMKDAMQIADDVFNLSKEKKYNLGAFIHGLVFALEYAQFLFKIPPQQIATIKRDCRKYFKEIENIKNTNK